MSAKKKEEHSLGASVASAKGTGKLPNDLSQFSNVKPPIEIAVQLLSDPENQPHQFVGDPDALREMLLGVAKSEITNFNIPACDLENSEDEKIIMHIRLLENIAQQSAVLLARAKDKIASKYNDALAELIGKKDEPYGGVKLAICGGAYELEYTIPKKVDWDQEELKRIHGEIASDWKENPDEYIDTKFNVSESAYKAWPGILQKKFIAARTVSSGKPAVKINLPKAAKEA